MQNAAMNIEKARVFVKQTAVALNVEFDCPGIVTSSDRVYELVFENASTAEEFIRGIYFAVRDFSSGVEPNFFDNKVCSALVRHYFLLVLKIFNEICTIFFLKRKYLPE